jgi:hypothetical protein
LFFSSIRALILKAFYMPRQNHSTYPFKYHFSLSLPLVCFLVLIFSESFAGFCLNYHTENDSVTNEIVLNKRKIVKTLAHSRKELVTGPDGSTIPPSGFSIHKIQSVQVCNGIDIVTSGGGSTCTATQLTAVTHGVGTSISLDGVEGYI